MPAPAPWAKTKQAVVSSAETDVVFPTSMVSCSVIRLNLSEQQHPVVLFPDSYRGPRRGRRRDSEAAQEIAVHVALALHGRAGEQQAPGVRGGIAGLPDTRTAAIV